MSFANRMIELRREKELTQDELAEKIGSSQKTISSWEKGRTTPRLKELLLLCKTLDCTPQYLTGIKMYEVNDISYQDIVSRIRSLKLSELGELRDIIDETYRSRHELQKMMQEKTVQEKRLQEYARRIAELERYIKRSEEE